MSEPDLTSPRRRPSGGWRRWGRRLIFGVLGVVVVLVAVHRPLAHWAIHYFGTRAAEQAGLQASWRSSGSIFGDFGLEAIRVTGGEGSMIRAVMADQVSLDYNLWRLRDGGPGQVVDAVRIRRLEVDLDLTRPRPGPPEPGRLSSGSAVSWPSVRVPVVDVEEVTARLLLPGGRVEVVRFSLSLDPSKPGRIHVARLVAPGMPELVEASGTTRATATSVAIENLSLWPGVRMERLVVDLSRIEGGRVGVDVAARQEEAAVGVVGEVVVGGADGLSVEAQATASGVSSETLAFWGIADGGMAWNGGDVRLRLKGPVMRPDRLEAEVTVQGASIAREGFPAAVVELAAAMRGGEFTVREASVVAGRGKAELHGAARLGSTWQAVPDGDGRVDASFQFPDLDSWLPAGTGVSGGLTGRVEAGFSKRSVTGVESVVDAAALRVRGLPVESVTARLTTTDGGRVQFNSEATINAANRVDSTGWLDLRGRQGFEVDWKARCRDLATVPIEARADMMWPTEGSVEATGRATGFVDALRRGDWGELAATAQISVARLKLRDGRLDSLQARAAVDGGRARVEEAVVQFDADNRVSGAGAFSLPPASGPISAKFTVAAPVLNRLSSWSTSFGGPALRAGSIAAEWEGEGGLTLLDLNGSGSVRARGLVVDGVPEPAGIESAVLIRGGTVSLNSMRATFGAWRSEGSATWDGGRVEVPSMEAWLDNRSIATLSASVPIGNRNPDGGAPLIREDAPVRFRADLREVELRQLSGNQPRPLPVQGLVKGSAEFSGTLTALSGRIGIEARALRPSAARPGKPSLQPATFVMTAALRNGQATVEATANQRPLQPARLQLRAPVDVAALVRGAAPVSAIPLNGTVTVPDSSLAFLTTWAPVVRSVQGTFGLNASIAGTVGRPQWQATARVQVPEVRLHGASLPSVRDLSLRIQANERRLTVQEATVMLAGGRLRVEGGADMTKLSDPVLDLRLRAEQVLVVRDDTLSLRANADVACRGPVSRADVSGSIDFVRGRVFKEVEFLPLSLPNQLPPPPPPTALARSGPPAAPPPFDAWSFNLAIRTQDPIRLMGNVVRGSVVADLRLVGSGARPVLTGKATMEQMWVKLPFSRLNITEGVVTFSEDRPFDPQINVVGESITDGRIVQVMVQGRALDPRLRFTSSPPLPEGEIASLLATGVTTGDLTSSGNEAAGRAAFLVIQQAYRRMFRQTSRWQDDAEPPRLSFNFALFGSDASRNGVSAIYEINPRWRLIGRVGQAGTFRGLVHYLIRFR